MVRRRSRRACSCRSASTVARRSCVTLRLRGELDCALLVERAFWVNGAPCCRAVAEQPTTMDRSSAGALPSTVDAACARCGGFRRVRAKPEASDETEQSRVRSATCSAPGQQLTSTRRTRSAPTSDVLRALVESRAGSCPVSSSGENGPRPREVNPYCAGASGRVPHAKRRPLGEQPDCQVRAHGTYCESCGTG